jgi:hypothetical protein
MLPRVGILYQEKSGNPGSILTLSDAVVRHGSDTKIAFCVSRPCAKPFQMFRSLLDGVKLVGLVLKSYICISFGEGRYCT